MAYDVDLANRLREQLADEVDVGEKAMFGGLAFFVAGHMTIAASRSGGLLTRADPVAVPRLLLEPHVEQFMSGHRVMTGWVWVGAGALTDEDSLGRWVELAVTRVRSLPPKSTTSRRRP